MNSQILCPKNKIISKNKKNYITNFNIISKFDKKESKIKYFSDEYLLFANPIIKSIINFSAIDLEKYNRVIRIYYPDYNTPKINDIILFFFSKKYNLKNWDKLQKKNHSIAFQIIADFLNINIIIVEKYEDADFVICNFIEDSNFIGISTFPHELDLYKNLENKFFIFYSNFPSNQNSSRGSSRFYFFLHHILHCFGLHHSNMKVNNDHTSLGVFYMNTILATTTHCDTSSEIYPQTLMPLDIEALKFLYNVSDFSKYRKWLDFNCSKNIIQTLVSNISLELIPSKFSKIFHLSLDNFSIDSGPSYMTTLGIISKDANDKYGATILGCGSYINEVIVNYEEIYIYGNNFIDNTKIILSEKTKKIFIFLQGFDRDFIIDEQKNTVFIIKKSNKASLFIENNVYKDVQIELFLLGDKILDKYPYKTQFTDFFEDEPPETRITTKNQEKISSEFFIDINQSDEKSDIQEYIIEEITDDDIGKTIINNLQEEHYEEIINHFFSTFPEMIDKSDDTLVQLLNKFGIKYLSERFKQKLVGKEFPLMRKILEKKKNEFKNTSLYNLI